MLAGYTERGKSDHDRLAEMMHYAEASDCRVRLIRQYFGEEQGEACGRCDNCMQIETSGRVAEPVHEERVETMLGSRVVDSPIAHEAELESAIAIGVKVRHARFGAGRVLDLHGANALVRFQKGGEKNLRVDFLTIT